MSDEVMPGSSNMDPPLAKAKFIKYGGSTSALTYCRRKRSYHAEVISARQEQVERNSPADTKVTTEEETGGAPGTRAEVPLQPLVQTMVRQLCSCSPWRRCRDLPADLEGDSLEQVDTQKKAVIPWEAYAGTGS
ncbi:hypothetical protein HGM15179_013557 [Zosterops borbonicus]|uniref:Uncharacterized protein n=1 Tax=Zosterops borbonicus TaxID=364589 RepID=A0A8K1LH17_9PASS|nr:hypothetical protein HGM15179_013557 [Zosterops borbonicus]